MKIKLIDKKHFIWDIIRCKYIKLTPEEVVRQNYINYLLKDRKYLKVLMSVEYPFLFNGRKKRADLVIFKKEKPFIIVEFKANKVKLGEEVLDQIMIYNKVINASYISITNGIENIVLEKKNNHYKSIEELPLWKK